MFCLIHCPHHQMLSENCPIDHWAEGTPECRRGCPRFEEPVPATPDRRAPAPLEPPPLPPRRAAEAVFHAGDPVDTTRRVLKFGRRRMPIRCSFSSCGHQCFKCTDLNENRKTPQDTCNKKGIGLHQCSICNLEKDMRRK